MKRLACIGFFILLVTPFSQADNQASEITLKEASKAAGLNTGAQQRVIKEGIDLTQLAVGITEAYRTKPNEQRLEIAREHVAVFKAPVVALVNNTWELNPPLTNSQPQANHAVISKKVLRRASADLGIILAVENQEQLKTLDVPAFMEGFKEGYTQSSTSPQLVTAAMLVEQFVHQLRMRGAEERLIKSNNFLTENAKRRGVIVTKSGLQYEILEQGSGAKPTWEDMVNVNYRHTKPNSNFRYDSAEHHHSETMPMRGTIPEGWHELFLLMNKGARYKVYLSPALGFGAEGNGDALLPNEVLITEFTLLDIIPPPAVVN